MWSAIERLIGLLPVANRLFSRSFIVVTGSPATRSGVISVEGMVSCTFGSLISQKRDASGHAVTVKCHRIFYVGHCA